MHSDESMAEDTGKDLGYYMSLLRRKRSVIAGWALTGLFLSVILVWVLPTRYASTATIIIEDPEIPPNLIGSTVTSFAEKRLEIIDQRIMTTRNLSRIVKEFDLYPELRSGRPIIDAAEQLRSDFELEKVSARLIDPRSGRHMSALISFNLTYRNRSPETAQKVTRELARLYLTYNYSDRREQANDVADFLASEAARLSQRVSQLEDRLTNFKETHPSFIAGQGQVLVDLIDRTETNIRAVNGRISTLSDRKLILQQEMEIAESQAGEDARGRMSLPQMRAELARISQIYGAAHPDVVLLKRRIAAAERAAAQGSDKNGLLALGGGGINPEATRVQAQLATVEAEMKRLREQRKQFEDKLQEYEKKAMASPQLEQQYLELRRDYDNAKAQYDETKKKQLVADQARVLEQSRKSERFTLLEPPQVPRYPAGIPDFVIIAGGFGLFSIMGLIVVLVMDLLDDRIHSARQLEAVIGTEPLMLVPVLGVDNEASPRRKLWSGLRPGDLRPFGGVRKPRPAS